MTKCNFAITSKNELYQDNENSYNKLYPKPGLSIWALRIKGRGTAFMN